MIVSLDRVFLLRTNLLVAILILTFTTQAFPTFTEWTGAVSTNWNDPANWNNGVPSATVDAVIKASAFAPSVPTPSVSILNLDIQAGGILNFEQGAILYVLGSSIQRNSGTINLGSGQIVFVNDVQLKNGGTFNADSGSVQMSGGLWENESGSIFDPGTSTVIFNGTSTQQIQGDMTFYNIQVTNTSGTVTFTDSVEIAGTLDVEDGVSIITDGPLILENGSEYCNDGTVQINAQYENNGVEGCGGGGEVVSTRVLFDALAAMTSTSIEVIFDRAVDLTAAQTTSNYQISHGITVSSAIRQSNTHVVHLTVSNLTANTVYTLTAGNITDSSGVAGTGLYPGSERLFSYGTSPASITVRSGSGQSTPISVSFTNPFRTRILDSYSLPIYGAVSTFTAPASGTSGTFASTGNNVATAAASSYGTASSPAFTANTVAGAYTVSATASGVATPANFSATNLPGTPAQLTFVQQPTDVVVNNSIAPSVTVQVQDASGNAVTQAGISVTMSLSSGSGSLSGTLSVVTDASGLATFNDLSTNQSGSKVITASSSGLTSAVSSAFMSTVVINHFVVETFGGGNIGAQTAGTPFNIRITAVDASNATVTEFGETVDLTSTGALSGGGGTSAAFSSGVLASHSITFSNTGSFTITATRTSGTEAGTSNSFAVSSGVLDNFSIEISTGGNIPTQSAGTPFTIKVTARDANGNLVNSFSGKADITSTGTLMSGGGATSSFSSGILASHSVSISNTGSFTITATKTGGTEAGTSNSFNVNVGPLDHFAVTAVGGGAIPDQIVDVPISIELTALDAGSNVVNSFTGTVDVTSTGTLFSGSGTSAAFTAGMLSPHVVEFSSAGSYTITATQTSGAISGASASINVNNPVPTLTSIDITAANRLQTLDVEFTGTNFVNATSVNFGAGIAVNSVTFSSSTQVTANITIGAAASTGLRDVSVTNTAPGGGTATLSNAFDVRNPSPTLVSLDLTSGSRLATMDVQLNGSGFIDALTAVDFGSDVTVNTVTVSSETELVANITIGVSATLGARDVSVSNAAPGGGNASLVGAFTINNPAPTVSGLDIASATRLQSLDVVISGTNFISGVTAVSFGPTIAINSTTVNSSVAVTVNISIPSTTAVGSEDVTVTNAAPGGGSATLNDAFTVTNPVPTVTSLDIITGTVFQTLSVVITGTNFIDGVSTASFGSGITMNSNTVDGPTQITVNITITAAAAAGTRSVSVTNTGPGGGVGTLASAFTVTNPIPTFTSTDLAGGTIYQTLDIVCTGSNFINGTTAATFPSGVTVNSVVVSLPTQLTANVTITSAASTGTSSLTISNPAPGGGSATLAAAFTVSNPSPSITSISPSSVMVGGPDLVLVVNGTNFISTSVVKFDGAARTTTFVSSTELQADIPASDMATLATHDITVTTAAPGGGTSAPEAFDVAIINPVPQITSISPLSKIVFDGAFTLTVSGLDFMATSVASFNGSPRTTTFVDATTLTLAIPASDIEVAGSYDITVFNPAPGGGTSNAEALEVLGSTVSGTVYNDRNGNGVQDGSEAGISGWTLSILGDSPSHEWTVTSSAGGAFLFENLPNDNYVITLELGDGWAATNPLTSTRSMSFASPGTLTGISFGVNTPRDTSSFRSFTPEDLAVKKPVRKQPIAVRSTFSFTVPDVAECNGLRVLFVNKICSVDSTGPFEDVVSVTPKDKEWEFIGSAIEPTSTFDITVTSCKLQEPTLVRWWWLLDGEALETAGGGINGKPVTSAGIYAMPNTANVRNEVYAVGGFDSSPENPGGGLVVGIPRTDSAGYFGWAVMKRSADMYASLADKNGSHGGQPRGFTFFTNSKLFLGARKTVPPSKFNNRLFAETIALKFNIAASEVGITPVGFGELVYEEGTNPLSGLSLREIASKADTAMTYWRGRSSSWYITLDTTIRKINAAFSEELDTVSYADVFELSSVGSLADITFLRADPSNEPVVRPRRLSSGPDLEQIPTAFELRQNYPNPFNPATTIEFDLPFASYLTLKIYNTLGQEIATMADQLIVEPGTESFEFDASRLPSGAYFYRIVAVAKEEPRQSFTETRKMLLLR